MVNEESDNGKKENEKQQKEKESIGNYKNDFQKETVEMQGVKNFLTKKLAWNWNLQEAFDFFFCNWDTIRKSGRNFKSGENDWCLKRKRW